jgi:hypothetical protein
MRFIARLSVLIALLLVGLLGQPAMAANRNASIQPNEHFVGLVDGSNVTPTVYTDCPGPSSTGRTGPVLSGQTLGVAQVASGGGYTGLFSQIYVWIAQDTSAKGPHQVKLTAYGTERAIPASVRVPCDGAGQVEFSSCPRLAPCAYGWIPDLVSVRFVNVAV